MRKRPTQRLAEYLTVGEAADFLGVSAWTLRNWDKSGKLKPLRHPKNGYRIYRHEDLQAILEPPTADQSTVDWSDIGASEHFVQFYDSEEFLIEAVSGFLSAGLRAGEACVVIATRAHRDALRHKLQLDGLDIAELRGQGLYLALDAEESLAKFMVNGVPDPHLFREVAESLVRKAAENGRAVRAFGEMVALLWKAGNRDAAIRLEDLWNELGKHHPFALLCAYPIRDCGSVEHESDFGQVCTHHSRVIPAESYGRLGTDDERQRMITALQQKAQSLSAEIAHRQEVEKVLSRHQQELREQDRRKDEFLAILAHELRNPLAPITNALEMMKLGNNDPEILDEARDIMERQVRQMVRMIEDLMDVSRITRGKLEMRKQLVDFADIVRSAVETSRPAIDANGHQLQLDVPTEPITVDADPSRMAQVLSNLLNNSAKYTENAGQIFLGVTRHVHEIVVRVKDNGIGIPPESLPNVFEMFKQVDQSSSRSQSGLGIGLTLVKRLVELHGGTIEAFSEGAGKGSEFVIRLPISVASTVRQKPIATWT